jgi:acylphosphatase
VQDADMTEDRRAVAVRVTGRVQGVGFRWWTQREAMAAGISGFARNAPDGSVEALVCGAPEAVTAMLARLAEGPPGSRVDAVETRQADPGDAPAGFEIRR